MKDTSQELNKYYSHIRTDLVDLIPVGNHRILEIGCAEGLTGSELKKSGRASEVVGIEYVSDIAEIAKNNLDHVLCGDIEMISFDTNLLKSQSFDYILCGDVLEHLKDPWSQVDRLEGLLKPGGRIIASLPNVRYWKVSMGLLFTGRWQYVEQGILDKTHLRFFVKDSVISLMSRPELKIESISSQGTARKYGYFSWVINLMTFKLLEDLLSVKYTVVASKVG